MRAWVLLLQALVSGMPNLLMVRVHASKIVLGRLPPAAVLLRHGTSCLETRANVVKRNFGGMLIVFEVKVTYTHEQDAFLQKKVSPNHVCLGSAECCSRKKQIYDETKVSPIVLYFETFKAYFETYVKAHKFSHYHCSL